MDTANKNSLATAKHMVSCCWACVAGLGLLGLDMAVEKNGLIGISKELRWELKLLLRKLPGPVPNVHGVL